MVTRARLRGRRGSRPGVPAGTSASCVAPAAAPARPANHSPRRRLRGPPAVLAAMVLAYIAVFVPLTWAQHANFGTFGFDMGIHDQGIWLVSRFEDAFVTVRGLHYFAHHVNAVTFLLVPSYWLGAGPQFLYVVETLALAAGAVPVWLLARDRLREPWQALVPAAAFLLYPALQWTNWWHFHPEALAITPLLFAWWLAGRRRWGWYAVAVGLALSTKEDVALAVVVLGVLVAVRHGRRPGLLSAAAGAAWFALCTRVVIPLFNGGRPPFYEETLFPAFGDDLPSVVRGVLSQPGRVLETATEAERLTYYWQLLAPVALLPLVGVPFLLLAGPQLAVNVLSALPGTHSIRFHYSSVVTAAVFVATVEALALVARRPRLRVAALALLLGSALTANVAWSPSPLGRAHDSGVWARAEPRHDLLRHALRLVPADAGVSASYHLVPHLTHRARIYEFPNPWIPVHWGVRDEDPHDPVGVDWLVLDMHLHQHVGLVADLLRPGGEFKVVLDSAGVVVARRRSPP